MTTLPGCPGVPEAAVVSGGIVRVGPRLHVDAIPFRCTDLNSHDRSVEADAGSPDPYRRGRGLNGSGSGGRRRSGD